MQIHDYLTVEQVLARTGVARSTLYRWMRDGELPHYKMGKKTLFKPEDVANLIRVADTKEETPAWDEDEEDLADLLDRIKLNEGQPGIPHDQAVAEFERFYGELQQKRQLNQGVKATA